MDFRNRLPRFALLLLAVLSAQAWAGDITLDGRWRLAAPQETAADVRVDDPALQAFEPSRLTHLASADEAAWVVLRPRDAA